MKKLLEEITKFQNEDLPDDLYKKLSGEILPAASVKVYWIDRDEADRGYVFVLPHQRVDEGDVCVHVPQMDNSDGIGDGEPVYCHLSKILTNKLVKKVVLKGGLH